MYTEKVISIFENPKHVGRIVKADGVGEIGSAACGDIMKIYLRIENNIIKDAKFQTFGCAAAIACTDVACSMIIGKTLEQALSYKNRDFINELGELPKQKIHCSILAEETIKDAIDNYYKKQNK